MSRGPDAAALLERALLKNAERAGCPVAVTAADWDRWASATFVGARHSLTVRAVPGELFDRWLGVLPEADFALRGHLVADLCIARRRTREGLAEVDLEVLTVEA